MREYEEIILAERYRRRSEDEIRPSLMILARRQPGVPIRPQFDSSPFQSFIIPVEAYGVDYAPINRRCLNILPRFMMLEADPYDGCGNLLEYLQQLLEDLYLRLCRVASNVPACWTQAGLSEEIWQEVKVLVHFESILRSRHAISRFTPPGSVSPIDNKKALDAWVGWVSRVYENEIDLRRAGIPVDSPIVIIEQQIEMIP